MSDDENELWEMIKNKKLTTAQVQDIFNGEPPRDESEAQRTRELVEDIIDTSISEWPRFKISWDLDLSAQRFALDGCRELDFKGRYPNGLSLVFVMLTELDAKLIKWNLRTPEEVWSVGDKRKAARCIVHWSDNKKITPPLAIIVGDKIGLGGGNHRLAIARAKEETIIPLLVDPTDKKRLGEIIEFQQAPNIE